MNVGDILTGLLRGGDNLITGFNHSAGDALDWLYDNTIGSLTNTQDAFSGKDIAPWLHGAESIGLSFIPGAGVPLSAAFNGLSHANELLDGEDGELGWLAADLATSFLPGAVRFGRNLLKSDKAISGTNRARMGADKQPPESIKPASNAIQDIIENMSANTRLLGNPKLLESGRSLNQVKNSIKEDADFLNAYSTNVERPLFRATNKQGENIGHGSWTDDPLAAITFGRYAHLNENREVMNDILRLPNGGAVAPSNSNKIWDVLVHDNVPSPSAYANEYGGARSLSLLNSTPQKVTLQRRMPMTEAHPLISKIPPVKKAYNKRLNELAKKNESYEHSPSFINDYAIADYEMKLIQKELRKRILPDRLFGRIANEKTPVNVYDGYLNGVYYG